MVSDIFDELIGIAQAQECSFPPDFKQRIMEEMVRSSETNSIMYQDFTAGRPMEVETYLGSPIKLAQSVGLKAPRIETLYPILHNLNLVNQQRKAAGIQAPMAPPVRLSSVPPPRQMMGPAINGNGMGRGRGRTSSMNGPPPGMRRGPPPMNGGPPNGYPPNGYGRPMTGNGYPPRNQSRRGSIEGDTLGEDFSHIALYEDLTIPESGESNYGDNPDIALRERELMLRQRELALREQEMRMRSGPRGPRRGQSYTPSVRNGGYDEDDDDEFIDPADAPLTPMIDPDNFDMMSVTSRRNRKAPSQSHSQIRKNPENFGNQGPRGGGGFMRPNYPRNRSSARIISQVPGPYDNIMDDPLMNYSSNRYANVDRKEIASESRANSLTAARLDELQYNGGPPNGHSGPYPRRASKSPGDPYSPQIGRGNGRPSPPNGYMGPPMSGRPSPPGGMRQPVPRHPPGIGNSVAPQQVEQYAGVSALHPPKGPINVRSLTGSASASAGSGDSANIDSEPSAHSSQSSLGPRPPVGVR